MEPAQTGKNRKEIGNAVRRYAPWGKRFVEFQAFYVIAPGATEPRIGFIIPDHKFPVLKMESKPERLPQMQCKTL